MQYSPPNHSTGEVYKLPGIIEKAEKEIRILLFDRKVWSSQRPKHSVETE